MKIGHRRVIKFLRKLGGLRRGRLSSLVNMGLLSVFSSHDHMPMVLHSIISPSREEPSNHGPFVAIKSMGSQEPFFFFLTESPSVDPWI